MGAQFSIRYKFLTVIMLLLAVCVGTYLLLASYIFKEDKRELVFDYNRSLVVNLSSDLDNFFKSLSDKMRLVAYFQSKNEKNFEVLLKNLLEQNPDLVWVGHSDNFKNISKEYFRNVNYQKTYGLEDEFFIQNLIQERPIPFSEIQRDGESIWSATTKVDGPALIGYGKNVIEENDKGVPVRQFVVVAFIKADRIIASLKESRPNESLVVSARGDILAHANPLIMQTQKMPDHVLFERAKDLKVRAQVLKYESGGQVHFGAFSKAAGGHLVVLSSISEKTAFKAVNDLVTRSLLFGSILITFSFILAVFFSRSLTRPIETLVGGMKQVSDGDLNTNIQIQSRDEISSLAHHFNLMISELKKSRGELESINRELENKVKERTLQLEQRNVAVKEAQEALLRSTRLAAVGEVAGLAAHEVLNPLTSIIAKLNDLKIRLQTEKRGEVQFLLDLKKSWESDIAAGGFEQLVKSWQAPSPVLTGSSLWQEDLSNIDKVSHNVLNEYDKLISDSEFLIEESQRINRIIQSFRGMSSVKNEMKELSAHKLSDRSITIMDDLAAKHNISIKKNYTSHDDTVWLDEDEFIQAMTNLLRNAIQSVHSAHSNDGLGEVTVITEQRTAESGQKFILVHVRDNGAGMTGENALKIFNQKFTTKSKSEGTGIGLSLSRRLVRAFKGDIKLTWNQVGVGAQFTIEIPLAAAKERASA